MSNCGTPKNTDKKRVRFNYEDDIALLKEFIGQNPLSDPEKWETIQKNIQEYTNKTFNIRTLKDHLFLILDSWSQKDAEFQKRSGIEENYSERDHLLQEVSDLCKNVSVAVNKKRRTVSKEKQIADLGRKARDECAQQFTNVLNTNIAADLPLMEHDYSNYTYVSQEVEVTNVVKSNHSDDTTIQPCTMTEFENNIGITETIGKPIQKRRILGPNKMRCNRSASSRMDAINYIRSKEERSNELRLKELELEERKLNLEERKLRLQEENHEMDLIERKDRLQMEKEKLKFDMFEREQLYKQMEKQQQLNELLLQRLKKYEDS